MEVSIRGEKDDVVYVEEKDGNLTLIRTRSETMEVEVQRGTKTVTETRTVKTVDRTPLRKIGEFLIPRGETCGERAVKAGKTAELLTMLDANATTARKPHGPDAAMCAPCRGQNYASANAALRQFKELLGQC